MILCELAAFILAMGCWMSSPDVVKNAASAGTYRASGLGYRGQLRYPEAIAAFQKAAQVDPGNLFNPHLLVALAIAHWTKGDRPAAVQSYRQAVQVDGRYGDRTFLGYLKEAGFHSDQVRVSEHVLAHRL